MLYDKINPRTKLMVSFEKGSEKFVPFSCIGHLSENSLLFNFIFRIDKIYFNEATTYWCEN